MITKLTTPTSTMTTYQIRNIVKETILWCKSNLGVKRYDLTFSVRTLGVKDYPKHAMYNYHIRTMTIFRDYCPTVEMVIKSVLHEYRHYLQNLRWYNNTLNKVGYLNHPQEIEAIESEKLYGVCWNDIKNKL